MEAGNAGEQPASVSPGLGIGKGRRPDSPQIFGPISVYMPAAPVADRPGSLEGWDSVLTPEDQSYLNSLSQVKYILRILFAFGVRDDALTHLLEKTQAAKPQFPPPGGKRTRLDTTKSNISRDTLEKCREILPDDLAKQIAYHDQIRRRLCKIFNSATLPKWLKRANRVNSCQQAHMLFISGASEDKAETLVLPYCCNARFCPACSRERSLRTFNRVLDRLEPEFLRSVPDLRWITFTIVNPQEGDLLPSIVDLLKGFRRLRSPHIMNGKRGLQWNCWTESVDGYLWNLEISHNMKARTWHPHIHVIYAGDFIPWQELKIEWSKALRPTGRVGDIKIGEAYTTSLEGEHQAVRECANPRAAMDCLLEVCKYTLAPFESDIPASCILELTDAIYNKRLFGSGGDWRLPPEQNRNSIPYWALEGGLARCLQDPDSLWTDKSYADSILLSCASSHPVWVQIVRNYEAFYWIQYATTENKS